MTVREPSAAEHLEAALALLGFDHGSWKIELDVAAGVIRRVIADPRGVRVAFSRDDLGDVPQAPIEMGESTA